MPEATKQTVYRWRQKYGFTEPDMAKQLTASQMGIENARQKKMVTELALDMEILNEVAQRNW